MSSKYVLIDTDLNSVLQDQSFDSFTVKHCRDEYLKNSNKIDDFIESRKFVYRQILRLVRLKLLKKTIASNAKESTYSKTPRFFSTQFKTRSLRSKEDTNPTHSKQSSHDMNTIEKQLKKYQVDLLAYVGESEEYMRLYKTNPEFKTLLESEYLQARDQSSKLLGQIKALKTVLHHYS